MLFVQHAQLRDILSDKGRGYPCVVCRTKGHLEFPQTAMQIYNNGQMSTMLMCNDCRRRHRDIRKRLLRPGRWRNRGQMPATLTCKDCRRRRREIYRRLLLVTIVRAPPKNSNSSFGDLLMSVLCTVCSSKYSMRCLQCSACQSAGLSIARVYSGVHPDHDSRAVTCPIGSQNHERGLFACR